MTLQEHEHQEPIRTARADDRPCELVGYHAPRPSRTQGHHRNPVFLQNEVWGGIRNNDLLWLCGTCHDNVHEWLSFLLGRARKPVPEPGYKAKREAERTLAWYDAAKAARTP